MALESVSDQVWVEFRSLIVVWFVVIVISTPDVARTGAQINPGNKKIAWAIVLILVRSSGRPFTVDIISISILP